MKKAIALICVFALLLSLCACAAGTKAAPVGRVLTDQAGREVVVPNEPQRIVSGYYISTSALIALGQREKLVGVEARADKRPIYRLSAPELMELPGVGSAKDFDLEGCAALQPDLVILPKKLKDAAQTLEELGIPVLLVNPENQQLLEQMLTLLAEATNAPEQGKALLAALQENGQRLNEALEGAERPKVLLCSNSSLLSVAGSGMYQSDLIDRAGGENVAAALPDPSWAEVSYEQILRWDPQYIILASDASYTVEDVLADANLQTCTAVREGKVYQFPNRAEAWDSPVPGGNLGAAWLASVLHPERFSAESCDEMIEAFYETFYGFSYAGS